MLISKLYLALLPAASLARPTFHKLQDIIGFETTTKNTLAQASLSVYNTHAVDVGVYLRHWRGDDGSTMEEFYLDWISPGNTSAKVDFKFETREFTLIIFSTRADESIGSQKRTGQMEGWYPISRPRMVNLD